MTSPLAVMKEIKVAKEEGVAELQVRPKLSYEDN
jgi:hypothetical protein